MSKQKKAFPAAVIICFLIPTIIISGTILQKTALQRSDFRRISSESFDTAFLSMYAIDTYPEEYLTYYRGMTVFKAENTISDFAGIQRYMKRIAKSGNTISAVYLGICPDKVSVDELSALTQSYPSVTFEFILACPSAAYWKGLSEEEYYETLEVWRNFLLDAGQLSGVRFYFYAAEEWLVANPALYVNDLLVTPDAAGFILANSDYLHPYLLTADNAAERSASLEQLTVSLRSGDLAYPDLSDTAIVFFGDSIFGNYTDGMSVPGAINGLTGATVYNCGYGGNSAAMVPEIPISLPGIVDAFFAEDLSLIPKEEQVYQGFVAYLNAPPIDKKLCFVINYGLNDYFKGCPVSSDDPWDITTYTGAVRTAVAHIKAKAENAQIILCTPSYSGYALNETDEAGTVHLHDYADAVLALAEELELDVVDNFYTLGIDSSNYTEFLPDLVHPNEKGRFMIAQKIIETIR